MYLSKLDIIGFKSFANKTHFDFSDGLTGIIGPNGCGKSNIVDAIRWVLGEQKVSSLRSDKMENVIFNGTGSRKPLGMAEVSLTIENTKHILPSEFTEVVITRRLFRSGESQYLLNRQPVRLKDIQNLFIDTGMSTDAYSIIELKMVELILSDNKEERRRLFEEAAGIKKYKMHRKSALRKLEMTQQELTRLNDIIAEVQRTVNSLARQVGKTRRYQELKKELRQKEIDSHLYKYQGYLEGTDPLKEELYAINESKEKFATLITQKESELEKIKLSVLDIEKEFQDLQKKLSKEQSQIQELEKQNLLDNQQMEMFRREKQRASEELEQTRIRLEEINQFLSANQGKLQEYQDEENRLATQFEEVGSEKTNMQNDLDNHKVLVDEKEKASRQNFQTISHMQEEINQLKFQIRSKSEEKERLQNQINEISFAEQNKLKEYADSKLRMEEIQSTFKALEEQRDQFRETRKTNQQELLTHQEALYEIEKNLSNLDKEIKIYEHILKTYEGYSSAIQYVMKHHSEDGQVLDTMPNLFSVSSEIQDELAHFLAELTEIVVVKDMEMVKKVLNDVQKNKQGALALVPEKELKEYQNYEVPAGEAEPVINYIQPAAGQKELVENLFRNVYRTDSLDQAIRLHKKYPHLTFISPDGYTMGSFVQIKGGSKNSNLTNLIGRKNYIKKLKEERNRVLGQQKELDNSISGLNKVLEKLISNQEKTEQELVKCRVDMDMISREYQKNELEKNNIEEKLSGSRAQIKEHIEQISIWEKKLNDLTPQLETINAEYDKSEEELNNLRKETGHIDAKLRNKTDEYNRIRLELLQIQNQYTSLKNDIMRNTDLLENLEKKKITLQTQGLDENEKSLIKTETDVRERTGVLHKMTGVFGELEAEKNKKEQAYQEFKNELLEMEENIFQNRKNLNQALERIKDLEFKIQEHELKANGIREQLIEYYQYEIEEPVNLGNFNPEKTRFEIESLNETLTKLGEVNLLAVEEHEKEKERLTFLKDQLADILKAEEQLLETIDELNKTAIEKFNVTYEAIRVNFINVFKEFFAQGDADLELIDRDDPLESDINIKVTPKGRKLQTLTLMSAGEKTLTAISLLFAIYLVKPSPFCILDEVDAPLDDVNIGRYTQALKNFSQNTQFAVVTHNKKTMEEMDAIYGITMEEEGVSRVVSVQFD